jgi:hypothetical protein
MKSIMITIANLANGVLGSSLYWLMTAMFASSVIITSMMIAATRPGGD